MKPMATATCFVRVRRWMLHSDRSVGGGSPCESSAGRLLLRSRVLVIAAGGLLLTLLTSLSVGAYSASLEVAEIQPETRSVEVVSGVTYGAGTRLRIPGTPWSFVVPDRWQSNRPGDAEMPFLIPEEGKELGLIFPLTDVTRESIREQLSEPLSLLHGLSFIPAGSETETETSIARSYEGEDMAGRALAFLGPDNTAVIYFLMGPAEEASSFQPVLERLGDSTRFVDSVAGPQSGL